MNRLRSKTNRSSLILASLLAGIASPAFGQTVRIDFGPNDGNNGAPTTSPDSNGNYWNNVTGNGAVAPGVLAGNMVTEDNTPTALGIRVHTDWHANGFLTGGLLAPDPLLLGDIAVSNATGDYFYVDIASKKASMTITGLDPARLYTFRFFGSRENTEVRKASFTITAGSGISTALLQNSGPGIGADGIYNGNDDEITEISNVQADSSGQAILDVSVAQGGLAYLNVMEIVAGAAAPPIVPVTNSGRVLVDFGRTDGVNGNITLNPDINGNYWNNFAAGSALPNLLTVEKMFTSDHAPTNISISTGSYWDANGIQNGGLLSPNPALLGDFAINTVTQDYIFIGKVGGTASMEISGLNPAKIYTFRMFGTRAAADLRETIYTLHAGNGVSSKTLQTTGPGSGSASNGNDDSIVEFTGVQSTTSTTIKLDLTAGTGGLAYIGALEILETGDAPVVQAPVSATKTVRIDFGRSDGIAANGRPTANAAPDTNGNWWNNFIGYGGVPSGIAVYNLVTTDNVPTTIDVMTASGGWDSNGRNSGGLKQPNGPNPALLGDFAIESATEDYFFRGGNTGDTSSLKISGLDPGKRYDFRMFATRDTAAVRETTYTVTGGSDPKTVNLQTSGPAIGNGGYNGNNDTIAEIPDVTPDSSGNVQLDVTIKSGGFAYLGILDIIEVADAPFQVTNIEVTLPSTVSLTFNSTAGKLYDIQASTTLAGFDSIGEVIATGPSTVFTRSGVNLLDREFFRVEDLGIAPPLFSEDFEDGNGGFTTEDKSAGGTGSDWQFGVPDSHGFSDNAVVSGNGGSVNCWGTDIFNPGFAIPGTNTCLRSPVIDLTHLTSATLTFAEALDFESNDLAEVFVVEAATGDVITGPIHVSIDSNPSGSAWAPVAPIVLPPAAFGQPVRLEWRFTKVDSGTDYLGWYIDDVVVTY